MTNEKIEEAVLEGLMAGAKAAEENDESITVSLDPAAAIELVQDLQALHDKAKRMGAPFVGAVCVHGAGDTFLTPAVLTHPDGPATDRDILAAGKALLGGDETRGLAREVLGTHRDLHLLNIDGEVRAKRGPWTDVDIDVGETGQ